MAKTVLVDDIMTAHDTCLFGKCSSGMGTLLRFPPGAVLYAEGMPNNTLYCLHEGLVAVNRRDSAGVLRVAALAEPGDVLGIRCLAPNALHTSTVIALQPISVCEIPRRIVIDALATDHALAGRLLREMCLRLERAESYLESAG